MKIRDLQDVSPMKIEFLVGRNIHILPDRQFINGMLYVEATITTLMWVAWVSCKIASFDYENF